MKANENMKKLSSENIWLISDPFLSKFNPSEITNNNKTGTAREYKISDLAHYMLNPASIEVVKKLVGCEVHYTPPFSDKLKQKIRQILPRKLHGLFQENRPLSDVFLSDHATNRTPVEDANLESHLNLIDDLLRPYDPTLKKLAAIDMSKTSDIVGICKDVDGSQSSLNLHGDIQDKINYISNFIGKNVKVILDKAYNLDGLFEMKGFDFKSYDPKKSHRLIKFTQEGQVKYCVINSNNKVKYWVEDNDLVHYLHLLEQSIKTNPKLQDSLDQCARGNANPFKIFFNRQLEIDYSRDHFPEIYKRVFEMYNINAHKKDVITSILNDFQIGILFSYVPISDSGEKKLFTNFSVMHNFKALEPIKDDLPQVYSEINKKASVTEAGKFYLLDSFRGYKNE